MRLPIATLVSAVLIVATASASGAQSSVRDLRQRALLLNLPDYAHVLYVLGDLNGDGVVDRTDLALLRQVAAPPSAPMPPAVRCVAAGDVNLDRKIDDRDVAMLAGWLKQTSHLEIPALYWQSGLACGFGQAYLAATIDPAAGEQFLIRFLDPDYSASNCSAEVHSGPVTIRPAPDGRGFVGVVSPDAKPGTLAVVRLNLPRNRRYYYNLLIRDTHSTD